METNSAMSTEKDYYRILGVLPDAEEIVIRAAYKALAQKYHPDKFQGDEKHAKKRMQEINEAYAILSDSVERKKYDGERGKPEYGDESTEEADDLLHTLDKDWSEAVEYFPDLTGISSSLSKYSKELEFTFKVTIILGKEFNKRIQISKALKENFIKKYFGTNKEIHEFAEAMFVSNRRNVLKKLNRAVNLLGSEVDPKVIIKKIQEDERGKNYEKAANYNDQKTSAEIDSLRFYASKILNTNESLLAFKNRENLEYALEFLTRQNIHIHMTGFFSSKYAFYFGNKYYELSDSELMNFSVRKAKEFISKFGY